MHHFNKSLKITTLRQHGRLCIYTKITSHLYKVQELYNRIKTITWIEYNVILPFDIIQVDQTNNDF